MPIRCLIECHNEINLEFKLIYNWLMKVICSYIKCHNETGKDGSWLLGVHSSYKIYPNVVLYQQFIIFLILINTNQK